MFSAIRHYRCIRFAAVFAALSAWFVLSNHCALAACAQPKHAEQIYRCCKDSGPEHKSPEEKPMVCCKSLAVTLPDSAKLSVAQPLLPLLPFLFVSLVELTAAPDATVLQLGGDPPARTDF